MEILIQLVVVIHSLLKVHYPIQVATIAHVSSNHIYGIPCTIDASTFTSRGPQYMGHETASSNVLIPVPYCDHVVVQEEIEYGAMFLVPVILP